MLKIGMIGTGRIAKRFVNEILLVDDTELSCVYNPHEESAYKFVADYCMKYRNKPIATMSWELLLKNCDAVYIATPHDTHYLYAKSALESGKHVLCEKPMVLVKKEAEELFDIAEKHKLILREAVKTAYCPGFLKLLEVSKSGKIGKICDVEATFTKLESARSRELIDYKTGGSVTELATYGLLPILKLLGCRYNEVNFKSLLTDNGVDKYTKIFLTYDNAMAMAKIGLGVKSEGQLLISGTKGYIIAESPWWLTRKFEVRYENPSQREIYEEQFIGAGLWYEIREFVKACRGMDSYNGVSAQETITEIQIIEKFLKQRAIK